ncbi:MAG: type III-A CRISPR-associated protein Csm2 [Chloroflexota bacterium]|nr:type III-A CRISPR-associated protein Csm2 [Chloroflexota bacterium]
MAFRPTSQENLSRIITDPKAAELLVKEAERIGKALAKPLSTSQVRAIFGEVRTIQGQWQIAPGEAQRQLILLKPKLAYRAQKEGRAVENLKDILSPAIDLVQNEEGNFRRFVEFFEAILAYHKAYGGR